MLTEVMKDPEDDAALGDEDAAGSARRLTPAEWAQIVDIWELGTASAAEICTRFSIKPETLMKRIKRAGIRRGSRAHEVKTASTEATKKAVERSAEELTRERKEKIDKAKSEHLLWTETIARQAMTLIANAKRDGEPFSREEKNIKTLERTMKILIAARNERFTLLDAHGEVDDKELPALTIRDLTDAEVKARREAQEQDDAEILDEDDDAAIAALAGEDDEEEAVVEDDDDE